MLAWLNPPVCLNPLGEVWDRLFICLLLFKIPESFCFFKKGIGKQGKKHKFLITMAKKGWYKRGYENLWIHSEKILIPV